MLNQTLQNYKRDLALRGYSPVTQKTYYRNIVYFLEYCKEPPEQITKESIKNYLYYLIKDKKLSESSLRQARSAIWYFFSQTIGSSVEVENLPTQKKKRKLPDVFTPEEVFRIIHCADNIKHKTILMLTYSSGLRVGEIVNLKISDILRHSMRLKVRDAKGGKDRYTLLSDICLNQLELYWKTYKPDNWLFSGQKPGVQISIRAVQHAYHRAKKKAGINKECGIHTLRHSFATHMLETGSGIFQLQKFLGHKHLNTTLIYVHLSEEKTIARSPLDVYANRFKNESSANR